MTRQENEICQSFTLSLKVLCRKVLQIMPYLSKIENSEQVWSEVNAELIAVGIFENQKLTPLGQTLDKHLAGSISNAIRLKDLTGKPGESRTFYDSQRIILVMGLGEEDNFDSEAVRKAGGSISKTALAMKVTSLAVECLCSCSEKSDCQALAEGLVLGSYRFNAHRTDN
ncbi:MAG: M17 family peptidase N-terminal domain-containing protein, partial [Verrucomicrobiota bacterium]|nr:M17 family peptidase N-terminal domain-containing protein [Verrucomicrobiota bacterium]